MRFRAAQGEHSPTALFISGVILAKKHVLVTPRVQRMRVHW
jgi:hypothetical protein